VATLIGINCIIPDYRYKTTAESIWGRTSEDADAVPSTSVAMSVVGHERRPFKSRLLDDFRYAPGSDRGRVAAQHDAICT
jgi:hypothetical protein